MQFIIITSFSTQYTFNTRQPRARGQIQRRPACASTCTSALIYIPDNKPNTKLFMNDRNVDMLGINKLLKRNACRALARWKHTRFWIWNGKKHNCKRGGKTSALFRHRSLRQNIDGLTYSNKSRLIAWIITGIPLRDYCGEWVSHNACNGWCNFTRSTIKCVH